MLENKNNWKAWIYLAPCLVLMIIFTFYPLFNTFITAFLENYNQALGTHDGFTFTNLTGLFANATFMGTVKNTLLIVFITVPLSTIISLLIALGLNSIKALKKVFQTIFFIPYVTNAIAIGMVFAVLFNKDFGLINSIFGLDGTNWIGNGADYAKGMFVLLFYITWNGLPFKILIILSGLQGIDKQYYQAAQIDNASKLTVFTKITVPLLSPILSYVLITSFIGAFKEYSTIIAIFGDTAGGTDPGEFGTVVWYIYYQLSRNISRASAAAVFLLVIILFFTAINMYISKKKVHY